MQPQLVTNNTTIAGLGSASISISYIGGIKAGGNTGYVDVQVAAGSFTCILFSPQAFAGNAFSQPFALQSGSSTLLAGSSCQVTLAMSPAPPATVAEGATSVAMTAAYSFPATTSASFGALTLNAPAGLKITGVTLPAGRTGAISPSPIPATGVASISITNIAPAVTPASPLTLNLTVKVDPMCSGTTVTWGSTVYAGTALSGTTFALAPQPPSQLDTKIAATACGVTFSPDPPKTGSTGAALPPLSVLLSGLDGSGSVTMTSTCTLSGTTSVAASGGVATFSNLVITAPGGASCKLTANAGAYGMATSQSFTVLGGPLSCEPNGTYFYNASSPSGADINTPGYWLIQRGAYNKDGGPCQDVGFMATNSIVVGQQNQSVTYNWDTVLQPGASFVHIITWNPEYVDLTTGMPVLKTEVSVERLAVRETPSRAAPASHGTRPMFPRPPSPTISCRCRTARWQRMSLTPRRPPSR